MKQRQLLFSLIILISIVLVSGCTNDNKESNQSPTTEQFDPSLYFNNETTGKLDDNDNKFSWRSDSDDIIVTADKHKEGEGPDSLSLQNITIAAGGKSYSIKPALNVSKVQSISLSADKKMLAVSFFYGPGSNVFMINLSNGDSVDLNKEIEAQGNGFVESVQAYNWSPKNASLAVAYGDTSSSKIAIVSGSDNKVHNLSTDSYISTAYVLWSLDGSAIDCVSEKPSDQYKLYRMNINEKSAHEVVEISRDDLSKLTEYGPTYFKSSNDATS
ncbi:hypothetical protein DFQ01_11139 [Paenibacillus cellulosilyticus]|uniref:WD40 repeat protein n=1 Tax=Paenibacillus cellulosilyticus TaxID=375489 RepID=A0A2V2YRX2_9BACL|nr:hypothetical protein [Paenibacillus cellulosilyticus]PWW00894.1 hypothetical protein DFQ01_11139 [Paenibacillus cellulosilyticus]QKS47551.1 hypothetical protein HUB94_24545 [Paenibacillus cellulosilyticus]